jgi:hypothetical protein
MSTYPISDLLALWRKGELTADQAIGYMLQNLLTISQRLAALEKLNGQPPAEPAQPPATPATR